MLFSQAPCKAGRIARGNRKRNRTGRQKQERQGVGIPRKKEESWGRRGHKERGRDPCLVCLPSSDMAGLIAPALIDSINNTALRISAAKSKCKAQ